MQFENIENIWGSDYPQTLTCNCGYIGLLEEFNILEMRLGKLIVQCPSCEDILEVKVGADSSG